MSEWPRYYILFGRTPIAVDMETWSDAFEKRHKAAATGADPWRVGRTNINDHCHVSTVFLGFDHNHMFSGRGEPILFETLIFGGPLDGEMMRYCTYEEAERGHAEYVAMARKACAEINAIADAAGAEKT